MTSTPFVGYGALVFGLMYNVCTHVPQLAMDCAHTRLVLDPFALNYVPTYIK